MPSPVKAIRKHLILCSCFVCHVQHNQENYFPSNMYLSTLQFFTPAEHWQCPCFKGHRYGRELLNSSSQALSRPAHCVPRSHPAMVHLSHCSRCFAWSLSPASCEVSTCTNVQAHTACICVAVVQRNTQENSGVSCWKARRKEICSRINKVIHMCLEQTPDSYYTAPLQRPTSRHSSAKWRLLIAQTQKSQRM